MHDLFAEPNVYCAYHHVPYHSDFKKIIATNSLKDKRETENCLRTIQIIKMEEN